MKHLQKACTPRALIWRPWITYLLRTICLGVVLLSVVCCAQSYRQYTGPARPDSEIAILKHSDTISYTAFKPKGSIEDFGDPGLGWWKTWEYELLPGSYEIYTALDAGEVENRRGEGLPLPAKVLIVAALLFVTQGHIIGDGASPDRICESTVTLDVLPGRTYLIDGDFVDDTCWYWVEDTETGEVVAGTKIENPP
jgi:hypothetical protein